MNTELDSFLALTKNPESFVSSLLTNEEMFFYLYHNKKEFLNNIAEAKIKEIIIKIILSDLTTNKTNMLTNKNTYIKYKNKHFPLIKDCVSNIGVNTAIALLSHYGCDKEFIEIINPALYRIGSTYLNTSSSGSYQGLDIYDNKTYVLSCVLCMMHQDNLKFINKFIKDNAPNGLITGHSSNFLIQKIRNKAIKDKLLDFLVTFVPKNIENPELLLLLSNIPIKTGDILNNLFEEKTKAQYLSNLNLDYFKKFFTLIKERNEGLFPKFILKKTRNNILNFLLNIADPEKLTFLLNEFRHELKGMIDLKNKSNSFFFLKNVLSQDSVKKMFTTIEFKILVDSLPNHEKNYLDSVIMESRNTSKIKLKI